MIMYFFKLDLMYFQCKIICIAIVTININAVHSWIVIRKCLTETNTLPLASYPLGNTSQFNRPVMLNKIKRIKDKTLTVQSLKAFLLFINIYLEMKKRILWIGWSFSHCIDLNWINRLILFVQYIYLISYKIAKKGKLEEMDLPFLKNDITTNWNVAKMKDTGINGLELMISNHYLKHKWMILMINKR